MFQRAGAPDTGILRCWSWKGLVFHTGKLRPGERYHSTVPPDSLGCSDQEEGSEARGGRGLDCLNPLPIQRQAGGREGLRPWVHPEPGRQPSPAGREPGHRGHRSCSHRGFVATCKRLKEARGLRRAATARPSNAPAAESDLCWLPGSRRVPALPTCRRPVAPGGRGAGL